jgi:hypothetical protein
MITVVVIWRLTSFPDPRSSVITTMNQEDGSEKSLAPSCRRFVGKSLLGCGILSSE